MSSPSGLLDMIGLSIQSPLLTDLLTRIPAIESESSEIVEIPRLNVQDKIAVQLLFLSKFPGIAYGEELRVAAEKQEDRNGFVLNTALELATLMSMASYWEDFKLKTIQYYLEKYTGIVGITMKMI